MKQFNDIYVGLDVHKATIAVPLFAGREAHRSTLEKLPTRPKPLKSWSANSAPMAR